MPQKVEKKKREYSKVVLNIVLFWGMLLVTYSYVLATFDKNPNEGVTLGVIGTMIGNITGYLIYQAKLKMSRDKYCLNKDGIPFDLIKDESENEEENHH